VHPARADGVISRELCWAGVTVPEGEHLPCRIRRHALSILTNEASRQNDGSVRLLLTQGRHAILPKCVTGANSAGGNKLRLVQSAYGATVDAPHPRCLLVMNMVGFEHRSRLILQVLKRQPAIDSLLAATENSKAGYVYLKWPFVDGHVRCDKHLSIGL
jgi:hypothetical protein